MEYERPNNIPFPIDMPNNGRVPTDEDLNFMPQDEWLWMDVDRYLLDFTEPYKPPKYTLSWKGVPFAPLGGVHNITGQSGNGKTMTIAQFIAAIISGRFGDIRYELSEEIPKPVVLYIDTEMERDNTIAVKNRVLRMANRNIGEPQDDFFIVTLRDVEDIQKLDQKGNPLHDGKGRRLTENPAIVRWKMILKAIWQYRPTVVFIDGLLDVVADFNDNIECQILMFKCMKLASHYNISLWCVLHQNPGGEKLVGHLGSFLERKVTDVIQTKKEKDTKTGDVTFTVSQKKARGRDISDWQFRVLPIDSWGMPEQLDQQRERLSKYKIEDVKTWLETYASECNWPASLTDIRNKIFKSKAGVKNNDELQQCVEMATNRRYLIEQPDSEMEKGQKHHKYYLNEDELKILPF